MSDYCNSHDIACSVAQPAKPDSYPLVQGHAKQK